MKENEQEIGIHLHRNTNSLEALSFKQGVKMEGTNYVYIFEDTGIAAINLIGPIYPRANVMTQYSGATSIQQYVKDFAAAYNNPGIKGLIQVTDSPGGDVRQVGESARYLHQMIRQDKKPVKAYVQGYAASAAYYTISPAQEIVSDKSGLSGSIGVVLSGMKKDENTFEIVSSVSPHKRPNVDEADGRAVLQQQVDDLGKIFVNDVSKYRGVEEGKVLADYGQGAVLVGPRAKSHGLIDRTTTLSALVDEMAREARKVGTTSVTVGKAAGWSKETLALFYGEDLEAQDDDSILDASLLDTEKSVNMGFKEMFAKLGKFKASDKTIEQNGSAQTDTQGSESQDSANENASSGPSTQVTLAQLNEQREALQEKFSDAGELFATQSLVGQKILPFQQASLAIRMVNARVEDTLFGGVVPYVNLKGELVQGTREEALKAEIESLPKIGITGQAVEGIKTQSVKASVLAEGDPEKVKQGANENVEVSEERRIHLLSLSEEGRKVLAKENESKMKGAAQS